MADSPAEGAPTSVKAEDLKQPEPASEGPDNLIKEEQRRVSASGEKWGEALQNVASSRKSKSSSSQKEGEAPQPEPPNSLRAEIEPSSIAKSRPTRKVRKVAQVGKPQEKPQEVGAKRARPEQREAEEDTKMPVRVPVQVKPPQPIIVLNLGGVHNFSVSYSTLTTNFPNSLIAQWFSNPGRGIPLPRLHSGAYYIDRDARPFRYVLQYLRMGPKWLPPRNPYLCSLTEVQQECTFYGLPWFPATNPNGNFGPVMFGDTPGRRQYYYSNCEILLKSSDPRLRYSFAIQLSISVDYTHCIFNVWATSKAADECMWPMEGTLAISFGRGEQYYFGGTLQINTVWHPAFQTKPERTKEGLVGYSDQSYREHRDNVVPSAFAADKEIFVKQMWVGVHFKLHT